MKTFILPLTVEELQAVLRGNLWDRIIGIQGYRFPESSIVSNFRIRETPADFRVSEKIREGEIKRIIAAKKVEPSSYRYAIYLANKKKMETSELVRSLASSMGLQVWEIKHLGLKDKRAVTSQFLCAKLRREMRPPIRMQGTHWDAELCGFSDRPLNPEDVIGNAFEITLKVEESIDRDQLDSFFRRFVHWSTTNGIPDFYGYQRFGTTRPINHVLGYLMMKRDFVGACDIVLGLGSSFEPDRLRTERDEYRRSHNPTKLLRELPRSFRIERNLCFSLSRGKTEKEAFMRLPITEIRFLLESFSNFIFNLTLSKWIGEGARPTRGDFFVPLDDFGSPIDAVAKLTEETEHVLLNDFERQKAAPAIPLPGYLTEETIYDETRQILEELEIDCNSFLFEGKTQASYPGGFRQALTWPRNLEISTSNWPRCRLSFLLKRGSYATILLRELLKPKSPISV